MNAKLKQLGLTPLKGAIVGVLCLVLIGVWGPQVLTIVSGDNKPSNTGIATPWASETTPTSRPRPNKAVEEPQATQPIQQPDRVKVIVELADAVSHDPFAIPSWSPSAAEDVATSAPAVIETTVVENKAESLRDSGAAMLLVSERGRAATIDGQTVYEGDLIDGFRVVEITSNGVYLAPDLKAANDP